MNILMLNYQKLTNQLDEIGTTLKELTGRKRTRPTKKVSNNSDVIKLFMKSE